jgi:predicted N-acetyltransferase YhbS
MADVPPVVIRPLTEADLADADRVFRVAFGTFAGVPEPRKFFGDAEFVRTRWHADNDAAFAAVREGRLLGSNFVTNWGSVGFFGPLSVDPACWNQGGAKRLMEPTVELLDSRGTRHAGPSGADSGPSLPTILQESRSTTSRETTREVVSRV